jgi:hypothetical protein
VALCVFGGLCERSVTTGAAYVGFIDYKMYACGCVFVCPPSCHMVFMFSMTHALNPTAYRRRSLWELLAYTPPEDFKKVRITIDLTRTNLIAENDPWVEKAIAVAKTIPLPPPPVLPVVAVPAKTQKPPVDPSEQSEKSKAKQAEREAAAAAAALAAVEEAQAAIHPILTSPFAIPPPLLPRASLAKLDYNYNFARAGGVLRGMNNRLPEPVTPVAAPAAAAAGHDNGYDDADDHDAESHSHHHKGHKGHKELKYRVRAFIS